MKMTNKFLALLFIVTLAFGCNKDDDDGVDCNISQLENTEWTVLRFEENDALYNPPGTYILQINKTSFSIALDVNTCGGNLDICDDDQLIHFIDAACTEACCDSDIAELIVDFLIKDAISFEVNGDELKVRSNSVLDRRLTLTRN